jgi:hypothetical protein
MQIFGAGEAIDPLTVYGLVPSMLVISYDFYSKTFLHLDLPMISLFQKYREKFINSEAPCHVVKPISS